MLRLAFTVALFAFVTPANALDLTGTLNNNAEAFQQDVDNRIATEREIQSQRETQQSHAGGERSFCYAIENLDARFACLGEAFSTENLNARNILNGHCSQINDRLVNLGVPYVCSEQTAKSCGALSGEYRELDYACRSCGGSRNWLATVVAGVVYQCAN